MESQWEDMSWSTIRILVRLRYQLLWAQARTGSGRVTAVDDLSLSVPAGRLFGFLGPNGVGKTTTIGCLTGLLDPTAGCVRLLGQDFTTNAYDLRRRIGLVPEGLTWL